MHCSSQVDQKLSISVGELCGEIGKAGRSGSRGGGVLLVEMGADNMG